MMVYASVRMGLRAPVASTASSQYLQQTGGRRNAHGRSGLINNFLTLISPNLRHRPTNIVTVLASGPPVLPFPSSAPTLSAHTTTTLSLPLYPHPLGSATSHFPRARVQGGTPSANCRSRKATCLNPRVENCEGWLTKPPFSPCWGAGAPLKERGP